MRFMLYGMLLATFAKTGYKATCGKVYTFVAAKPDERALWGSWWDLKAPLKKGAKGSWYAAQFTRGPDLTEEELAFVEDLRGS